MRFHLEFVALKELEVVHGRPLPGLARRVRRVLANRGGDIHTFVKFDEFLMNLSPNSIRNRQIHY